MMKKALIAVAIVLMCVSQTGCVVFNSECWRTAKC